MGGRAYRGSNARKVEELTGIAEIGTCRAILGGVMDSKMNGFVASKLCKQCEDVELS